MFKNTNIDIVAFLLVVYSLTITADGLGGPLLKATVRIGTLVFLIATGVKKSSFRAVHKTLFWYLIVVTLPFLFSIFRGNIITDYLQYLMYLNCIFFVHFCWSKRGQMGVNDLLIVSFPFVLWSFVQGIVLNDPLFWRETFTDGAIRLGGRVINPNELGMLAALSTVVILYKTMKKTQIFLVVLLVISCSVVLLTQSRSSLIALAIGIFVLLDNKNKLRTLIIFFISTIFLGSYILNLLPRSEMTADVFTLTGRAITWRISFTELLPKYWLYGAGFQQFPGGSLGVNAQMAHNTFIQQMIGGGVVGLILGLLLVFKTWITLPRAVKACFAVVGINSLTEFGFFGLFNHAVLLFALIATMTRYETVIDTPNISERA